MTKDMRQGLGLLCVATMCLLIGLVLNQNEDGTVAGALGGGLIAGAGIIGLTGLGFLAVQLLRNND